MNQEDATFFVEVDGVVLIPDGIYEGNWEWIEQVMEDFERTGRAVRRVSCDHLVSRIEESLGEV